MSELNKQDTAQLEREVKEVEQQLVSHEQAVAKHFDEVARATRALEEEQAKKSGLEQQLKALQDKLSEEKPRQEAPEGAEPKGEDAQEKLERHSQLVRDSDLFDAQWYLAAYPDVAKAAGYSQAPHEHYLRHGGFEGRNPCPEFDSAYYLKQSPDVAEAGTNPLVHYLQHGRKEGRRIHPAAEEKE